MEIVNAEFDRRLGNDMKRRTALDLIDRGVKVFMNLEDSRRIGLQESILEGQRQELEEICAQIRSGLNTEFLTINMPHILRMATEFPSHYRSRFIQVLQVGNINRQLESAA